MAMAMAMTRAAGLGLFVLATSIAPAAAQSFPAKPLRILIPAAPGANSDLVARGIGELIARQTGQPVFVENRAGADGIIGMEACAKAAPDGYTLCGTTSGAIVWNTVQRRNLPYGVLRDLAPVVHGGFFDSVLVANAARPYTAVQDLVAAAKASPGKVNWGHFGVNSTGYMYLAYLNKSRGVDFFAVPYKSQPQNILALVSGETDVTLTSLATAGPHIKAGKLRALAVTSSQRVAWLPNVPTFEEEGIKLPLRTWFGYHYQAAVPKEIVTRMNGELRRILESPSFRNDIIDKVYVNLNTGTPEEFDAFVRDQIRSVRELVAGIGIKPED
jgi:tripartite-type tricarboxylate transporter receptor subunit TctC